MPIVRLPNMELRDEIRQPLYDTEDLEGAAATLAGIRTFFQSITGKSLTETNLTQAGALGNAQSFRIQGMALDAQNVLFDNQQLLPVFMENSALSLKVGEKVYWQSPARFTAGRMWQDAAVATTVAVTTLSPLLQQFGMSCVAPVVFGAKHVVDINPLQPFSATLTTDALSAAEEAAVGAIAAGRKIRLVYSLKGLFRRPVQ